MQARPADIYRMQVEQNLQHGVMGKFQALPSKVGADGVPDSLTYPDLLALAQHLSRHCQAECTLTVFLNPKTHPDLCCVVCRATLATPWRNGR